MLNVDMVGLHQERSKAVLRLARLPYSMPHFLSDVAEDFMHRVGHDNSTSLGNAGVGSSRQGLGFYDPVFAPTGSRDTLHYLIDEFDGPSDHEDVADASIGLPAVMYGDWPNLYLGTQEDDLSHADATQLRRCVLMVGATAYYLAALPPDGVATLAPVMVGYAQSRLGREAARAAAVLNASRSDDALVQYREASNILRQALARELTAIDSLGSLGDSPGARAAIASARRQLEAIGAANVTGFREFALASAARQGITLQESVPRAADRERDALLPRRNENVRGPVNFFRPEYGLTWLRQKTGDDDFRSKVNLARRGHYVLYEALNFANGTRTLDEIRDAVSAEYGSVSAVDLEQYFRLLESVGVVSIGRSAQRER
jgi:hypothetical protein